MKEFVTFVLSRLLLNTVTISSEQGTQAEWRTVFLLTGVISAFGGVFYLIRRKGGVQSWGMKDDRNDNSDEENNDVVEPLIEP